MSPWFPSIRTGWPSKSVAQRCKGAHASLAASECTCTADSSWAPKWTTERCGPQDCCLSGRQYPCRRRCLEELLLARTSAQGPGRGPTQSWLSSQLKLTTNPLAVKRMQNKKEWTSGCQSDSSFSVTNLNLNEARWKTHASTKYQKVDQKVCGALLNHLHRHLQVRQVLLNLCKIVRHCVCSRNCIGDHIWITPSLTEPLRHMWQNDAEWFFSKLAPCVPPWGVASPRKLSRKWHGWCLELWKPLTKASPELRKLAKWLHHARTSPNDSLGPSANHWMACSQSR